MSFSSRAEIARPSAPHRSVRLITYWLLGASTGGGLGHSGSGLADGLLVLDGHVGGINGEIGATCCSRICLNSVVMDY